MVIILYVNSFEFSNGNVSFSVPSIIKKFIPYRNKTLKRNYIQKDLETFKEITKERGFIDEQVILYLLENHNVKFIIYLDKFYLLSFQNNIDSKSILSYEFEGILSRYGIHIFAPKNN